MQSNNNSNILNHINFHTSSTPCYWWSRWKPPTPTATASGWPAAPARAATSGAAARCRPACAALHRLHTSSLCLQHSMQASVWSSTARSTRAVSQADACDQPAPSRSHCPCPAHRCGLCDGLLHLYACLWYVMSHAYLLRECHRRKTRVQKMIQNRPQLPNIAQNRPKLPRSTQQCLNLPYVPKC